jgi:hypothetical protein
VLKKNVIRIRDDSTENRRKIHNSCDIGEIKFECPKIALQIQNGALTTGMHMNGFDLRKVQVYPVVRVD